MKKSLLLMFLLVYPRCMPMEPGPLKQNLEYLKDSLSELKNKLGTLQLKLKTLNKKLVYIDFEKYAQSFLEDINKPSIDTEKILQQLDLFDENFIFKLLKEKDIASLPILYWMVDELTSFDKALPPEIMETILETLRINPGAKIVEIFTGKSDLPNFPSYLTNKITQNPFSEKFNSYQKVITATMETILEMEDLAAIQNYFSEMFNTTIKNMSLDGIQNVEGKDFKIQFKFLKTILKQISKITNIKNEFFETADKSLKAVKPKDSAAGYKKKVEELVAAYKL